MKTGKTGRKCISCSDWNLTNHMQNGGRNMKLFIILLGALLATASAQAADTSYLGIWKFTQAVEAPWSSLSDQPPDKAERTRLMGKVIILKPNEIVGPAPFPCAAPHYDMKDNITADLLFEGMFEELHAQNAAMDPQKQAEIVGF